MKRQEAVYETKISDAKWIAYDIPGNIGWILYIVFWVRLIREVASGYAVIAALPAVLMIIGIIELISERIHKLDRILPKARLYRGFGALTLGGILGVIISVAGLISNQNRSYALWMLIGSILCSLFAGLLFAGYKKIR